MWLDARMWALDNRADVMGEVRRRPPQDLVLGLQHLVPAAQLPQFPGLASRYAGTEPVVGIGDLQPQVQARLGNPEVLRALRQRRLALAGNSDHITPELRRERLGHDQDPSSEDQIHARKESTQLGAVLRVGMQH
jgi:hypothetical protein